MPILQTFNGKLAFNPHVHALTTAGDPHSAGASIFFDNHELTQAWQRLVIMLLRAALEAGELKSAMTSDEIERLLNREENRAWNRTHVQQESKVHFLQYGGRYLRRPPFSEQNIDDVAEGFVQFTYLDKRTHPARNRALHDRRVHRIAGLGIFQNDIVTRYGTSESLVHAVGRGEARIRCCTG